jgi:hypothetical protein
MSDDAALASVVERFFDNCAAHLLRVQDDRIMAYNMVEAKPADSDAFWC